MKIPVTILLLFVSLVVASARLGETNTEIVKRYGPVKERKQGTTTNEWSGMYIFKEYVVQVFYSNNVSVCEAVLPIEKRKMTQDERDALLKAIGGSGKWIKPSDKVELLGKTLYNTETKAMARIEEKLVGPDALFVMTESFYQKLVDEETKKQKSKADGF